MTLLVGHLTRKIVPEMSCNVTSVVLNPITYTNILSAKLCKVITNVWSTGRVPAEWKEGIIVSLYKGKGS